MKLNHISHADMLPIFTKKQKYWASGQKIVVYIQHINSIEHRIFLSEWLGISSYRYKKILKREVFSGNSHNVREVSSDDEMILSILTTPYSIGYLMNGQILYSYVNSDSTKLTVIQYD